MTKQTNLNQDADQALQGIRIVLPGTQTLMGFQFIAIFNPIFQGLSTNLKILHFVSLLCAIVCSVLLIAPVAFQQLGEEGDATAKFLSYTRKVLISAMAFLLLAITGDVYLTGRVIGAGHVWALGIASFVFLFGVFVWYVFVLIRGKVNGKN